MKVASYKQRTFTSFQVETDYFLTSIVRGALTHLRFHELYSIVNVCVLACSMPIKHFQEKMSTFEKAGA